MIRYIPDNLYKDINNKEKVSEILDSVPDTDVRMKGIKTIDNAIKEIRDLGENEIADFLK
jgi:hypothetical protein